MGVELIEFSNTRFAGLGRRDGRTKLLKMRANAVQFELAAAVRASDSTHVPITSQGGPGLQWEVRLFIRE